MRTCTRRLFKLADILLLVFMILSSPLSVLAAGNPAANLDQCANGSTGTEPCLNNKTYANWVNGNLGASKSLYFEGDSIPYRLVFTDLSLGSHTVTIEWDTTQNDKHALDYITSWDRNVNPGSDPTSGVTGTFSTPTTYPIPLDPQIQTAGVTQVPGVFTLYNGTITAVSSYSYPAGTGFAGNKSAQISITFTATDATAVLAWGGHIATRQDWGYNNSAVAISGSPYHTRLIDLDGSGGNQDRSLSSDAVIFPGSITIIKDAIPDGSTSFPFTASPSPLANFSLVDDGTSANTKLFSNILTFATYTVTETPIPTNWSFDSVSCTVVSPNGGSYTSGSATVSIDLKEGELWTCTFTNKLQTGTLIVEKNLINDNLGPKTCPDFSYTVNGGTAVPFEADCSNSQTVVAGAYTVVEVGVPIDGYTTSYNNCENVSVPAGGSATCTITNDDIAVPGMTVKKSSTTTSLSAPATVTYSYLVTNTGNTSLTGITLSDDNATGMSCPATTLAVGADMTCTATHDFTQAELDANGSPAAGSGKLHNVVTADSDQTAPVTDSLDIPITTTPGMTVKKSSATTSLSAPTTVTYSYLVTNTGNVTLTGIALSDNNATGMSCPATTLLVGTNMTCTATHEFTQAELDANGSPTAGSGMLHNVVTADSDQTAPVTDSLDIPIMGDAGMTVKKSSMTTSLSAPATVTYSYLVTNTGNLTLTGISLSDNNATGMSCPGTTLAVGASMTCSATHDFTQAELDANGSPTAGSGKLHNVVTADSDQTPPVTDSLDIPISQTPGMTVKKSSTTSGLSAPATVTYSYLVTNTGNVTLTGISLTDNNATGMNCPATTLAIGASMTCSATHDFTQAELDANGSPTAGSGKLHNVVTADSDQTAPVTDSLDIPITQTPGMTVEKSSTTTDLSAPATVTYSYLVTNTGNVTLTGITLSDDNATGMSCPAATLAVGAHMTCTATHNFTQAELDANGSPIAGSGNLHNVVTADSDQTAPVTDSLDIPITQTPGMTVEKSSTTTDLSAPAAVTYSYLVTNTGNVTLTGISLSDNNATGMSCPATTLAVGANMTCTATHDFTQAELDANGSPTAGSGYLHNVVTADSDQTTPVTDSLDIPITQTPGMTVKKSSTTTGLSAPATVTYSYLVTNTGNITLTGISLSDDNASAMSCPGTTLAVGASMTCNATHNFTQAELDANGSPTAGSGKLHNVVTADSDQTSPVTDSLDIPITQTPGMTVKKSSATTSLSAPATVTYSYLVTNTGNVTLTGIALSDDNATGMSCPATTLAVGAHMTCTATHAFTQTELDANGSPTANSGKLHNVVTADSDQTTPVTDSLDIPITQTPAISLTKAASPTLYSKAGDLINYTLVVKNTGNVTLHNVTISDPMVTNISCPKTVLTVGESMTCTGTYTIQAADTTVFSLTNTATVTGKGPQDQPVTAKASATIYRQTGALLPTQTTCQMYASGQWPAMYSAFTYQAKASKISSVSPGVIFYYNTIQAPGAAFNLTVVETNASNWKPMLIQDLGQAILYNSDCTKASVYTVNATSTATSTTVTFTVTGAKPGAIYYIGIKYSPQNLIGQSVKPNPTSVYTWSTTGYSGSTASIPVIPKK